MGGGEARTDRTPRLPPSASAFAIRLGFCVQAQQVQDGGVQVLDAHRVLHGPVAEVVGRAMDRSALDSSTGHPETEAPGIVVPAGHAQIGQPGTVSPVYPVELSAETGSHLHQSKP